VQHQLTFVRRGGARRGAGRKRVADRPLVPHTARPRLAPRFPVLVTTRVRAGLPSLRRKDAFAVLTSAFAGCCARSERHGMRLVHFSVQTNHIHFLVEARDAQSLSRGMQGLLVCIARGLNRLWNRRGPVVADRYHSRILRSPREVRHALAYVLNNARRHGCHLSGIDPFTSGGAFEGWNASFLSARAGPAPPVMAPRTWLLTHGWRRHGLIGLAERPGPAARARDLPTPKPCSSFSDELRMRSDEQKIAHASPAPFARRA
jgi:REP element-mobilizing transposase RayT